MRSLRVVTVKSSGRKARHISVAFHGSRPPAEHIYTSDRGPHGALAAAAAVGGGRCRRKDKDTVFCRQRKKLNKKTRIYQELP